MMEWIGLAALGAFGAAVYRGYNWVAEWLRRTLTVEIEIKEVGAFRWVAEWLAVEGEKIHCRKLTAQEHDVAKPGEIYSPLRSRVLFIPGIGSHVFTHNGRRVFAERTEASGSKVGDVITDFSPEKITLRMWGRDMWRLKKLVTDAEYVYRVRRNHSLSMWVGTTWGDWNESGLSSGRAASTVMLPEGSMETLLVDVRKFLGMRDRYDAIGVPYRRGYIFHGIPGCGKSSLAKAIATECGLNLYVLSLSSGINDANLQRCLDQVRPHSVVLLEDIDAAYNISLLLREVADKELTFIIPRYAKSAATMITCSGDNILMTSAAELGPIDPQITWFNPLENRLENFSPLDIDSTLSLIRDEYANGNTQLADKLMERLQFPLTLGSFKKSLETGVDYTRELLSTRMLKDSTNLANSIAETLTKKYPSHGYCLKIKQLKDLGLKVDELGNDTLSCAWNIHCITKKRRKLDKEIKEEETMEKLKLIPPELLKKLPKEITDSLSELFK